MTFTHISIKEVGFISIYQIIQHLRSAWAFSQHNPFVMIALFLQPFCSHRFEKSGRIISALTKPLHLHLWEESEKCWDDNVSIKCHSCEFTFYTNYHFSLCETNACLVVIVHQWKKQSKCSHMSYYLFQKVTEFFISTHTNCKTSIVVIVLLESTHILSGCGHGGSFLIFTRAFLAFT
jgi:hypothetical protein